MVDTRAKILEFAVESQSFRRGEDRDCEELAAIIKEFL